MTEQERYNEIKAELNELYERSRRAIHPAVIADYEAQISYKETELATVEARLAE